MRCPRCSLEHTGSSHTCAHCGAPLKAQRTSSRRSIPWFIYVPAGVLLILCLILVFRSKPSSDPPVSSPDEAAHIAPSPRSTAAVPSDEIPTKAIVGRVVIRDNLGRELARLESLVLNQEWIALPIWACLAGDRWTFHSPEIKEAKIQRGIWSQGMSLGLWKLESTEGLGGPALATWNPNAALDWRALDPDSALTRVNPDSPRRSGSAASFSLPTHFGPPGVFLQNDRIVGWTFGQAWDKGFLWTGPENFSSQDTVQIRDVVNVVFAQSQESQFIKALSVEALSSPSQQLRALVAGYRLFPLLADEDKPPHIHLKAVNLKIRSLCRKLQQSDLSKDMTDIVDDQIIRKAQDVELLKILTQAWINAYDHRRALYFFQGLKDSFISRNSHLQAALDPFHLLLFKQWIQSDLDQERLSRGWEAFEIGRREFPDEPELQLLGVELAIAGSEWARAEELLRGRSYPAEYKDRAADLEVILIQRKSESGKITVRFPANSQEIPIDILVNKRVLQRFIIDTGADMVTIPSEAVKKLGITLDENTPVHRISTASGYSLAYEVNLNLMEIKGYRVHNIQALVLDIPGAPGVGLLGQNYLKHFELEIDSKKGLLRLKRR